MRSALFGSLPEDRIIDGKIPPAKHPEPKFTGNPQDQFRAGLPRLRDPGHKKHSDSVFSGLRQIDARQYFPEKPVRQLKEDPRAVSGLRVAPRAAAMFEIF